MGWNVTFFCQRYQKQSLQGDRRASYCAEHKLAGMINVSSRRCQHTGCLRHPNFGFPGDRRASYCRCVRLDTADAGTKRGGGVNCSCFFFFCLGTVSHQRAFLWLIASMGIGFVERFWRAGQQRHRFTFIGGGVLGAVGVISEEDCLPPPVGCVCFFFFFLLLLSECFFLCVWVSRVLSGPYQPAP